MKLFMTMLAVNFTSLACVAVAGYLAVNKIDGWGWFLFVAVILFGAYYSQSDKDNG